MTKIDFFDDCYKRSHKGRSGQRSHSLLLRHVETPNILTLTSYNKRMRNDNKMKLGGKIDHRKVRSEVTGLTVEK